VGVGEAAGGADRDVGDFPFPGQAFQPAGFAAAPDDGGGFLGCVCQRRGIWCDNWPAVFWQWRGAGHEQQSTADYSRFTKEIGTMHADFRCRRCCILLYPVVWKITRQQEALGMGYAQPVRSPKGDYWLARFLNGARTAAGKPAYGTVKDEPTGKPVRYRGKRDAEKAAAGAEAAVREGRWKDQAKEEAKDELTFGQWAGAWYNGLDLAPSTMANYKSHLELILATFQDSPMTETGILPPHIDAWENQLRAGGYAGDSIRTYRGTLHTCLEDAVPHLLPSNPATRKPNRGKRGVAKANAAAKAEKVITTVLGGLLIAERMAILTGRDDEFAMTLALQHGALRLGEAVGLERTYAPPAFTRPGILRVEWQLSEVRGKLIKAIPKYGSRGDIVIAPFLGELLAAHQRSALPAECPCHGHAYLFRGLGTPRGIPKSGVTIRTVAEAAGVSAGTVSNVITRPDMVAAKTRAAVEKAIADLGWVPGSAPAEPAWHWRRSAYEELFTIAASGKFPDRLRRRGLAGQPVPLAGEWPGARVTGRYAARRADLSWLPVSLGLTPHGLRHSQRTWMEENKVHHVLAEAQMRHELRGIDVYRHVTDAMREEFRGLAEEAWRAALARRLEMAPGSPVRVLDGLLRKLAATGNPGMSARNPQERPLIVLAAK
jgi:hypothetical protein